MEKYYPERENTFGLFANSRITKVRIISMILSQGDAGWPIRKGESMNNNPSSMSVLIRNVTLQLLLAVPVFLAMFFLPAGTFAYWEAWVYLVITFGFVFLVFFYFLKNDPGLLERRMKMREKITEQKLIVNLSFFPALLVFLLPGFDIRFDWSNVPVMIVVIADILVVFGYIIVFLVFRENRYASRIIEIEQGQTVIDSGPYAIVRHPMYLGTILLFIFSPLALASYWAMIPGILFIPILVARIINEESVLVRDLNGYQKYMQKTRFRLIPGIW